jgi:hypothetical protein
MSTVKKYDPYSFFYLTAENNDTMPLDASCAILKEVPKLNDDCNEIFASFENNGIPINEDDIKKCLDLRLCQNKDKASEYIYNDDRDGTSKQKYEDIKKDYNEELMNTVNLTIGIVFLGGLLISKYYNGSK